MTGERRRGSQEISHLPSLTPLSLRWRHNSQHLFTYKILQCGAGQAQTRRRCVIQRPPLAHITQSSCVMCLHAAATFAAHHQPGQNRRRRPRRAGDRAAPAVLFQATDVGLVLLPAQVRGVVVAQEDRTVLGRAAGATAAALTWPGAPWIRRVPTPCRPRPGIEPLSRPGLSHLRGCRV